MELRITAKEYAEKHNIPLRTVYYQIKTGILKSEKKFGIIVIIIES